MHIDDNLMIGKEFMAISISNPWNKKQIHI